MANAKKCDRCGVFYLENTKHIVYVCRSRTVLDGVCFRTRDGDIKERMDLCDDCITKLKLFLDGKDLKEG